MVSTTKKEGNGLGKAQIDYILISKRFRDVFLSAKTYPNADYSK